MKHTHKHHNNNNKTRAQTYGLCSTNCSFRLCVQIAQAICLFVSAGQLLHCLFSVRLLMQYQQNSYSIVAAGPKCPPQLLITSFADSSMSNRTKKQTSTRTTHVCCTLCKNCPTELLCKNCPSYLICCSRVFFIIKGSNKTNNEIYVLQCWLKQNQNNVQQNLWCPTPHTRHKTAKSPNTQNTKNYQPRHTHKYQTCNY